MKKPLERVSLDLTDVIAEAQEYLYVLTICDHYSRYAKFYPLKTKHTEGVCEGFKSYIMDFGTPKVVLTDNGKKFTAQSFRDLCGRYKITAALTTPYHPQGNNITERMHCTMKSVLACLCQRYPLPWPKLLLQCQSILNTAVHTTTGVSPYYAFFSRPPLA